MQLYTVAKALDAEHFRTVVDAGFYLEGEHKELGHLLQRLNGALYELDAAVMRSVETDPVTPT